MGFMCCVLLFFCSYRWSIAGKKSQHCGVTFCVCVVETDRHDHSTDWGVLHKYTYDGKKRGMCDGYMRGTKKRRKWKHWHKKEHFLLLFFTFIFCPFDFPVSRPSIAQCLHNSLTNSSLSLSRSDPFPMVWSNMYVEERGEMKWVYVVKVSFPHLCHSLTWEMRVGAIRKYFWSIPSRNF